MLPINYSSLNTPLSLLKQHCDEWKILYSSEIKNRHDLGALHLQEYDELQKRHYKTLYVLEVAKRHLAEIKTLKLVNHENRVILKDKQFRENADLAGNDWV